MMTKNKEDKEMQKAWRITYDYDKHIGNQYTIARDTPAQAMRTFLVEAPSLVGKRFDPYLLTVRKITKMEV